MLKFHHLGIACENIREVSIFLESTFDISKKSKIIFLENQGVDACLLTNDDGTNIELVSGKTIQGFIKKKQFLYHSCWEVDDIDVTIKNFTDNGSLLISEPKPSLLFNSRKVAFLYTDIGILELLEAE
jgi:methylmalonyl-CoA/ethylmalonyl-CoA epimerase